jgi:hypothetical protein
VEHDRVGSDQLRDGGLKLQLVRRRAHHLGPLGVEHHELVRVEAEADVALPRELARTLEGGPDLTPLVQRVQHVPADGMRAQGQDLAVDAERADAELGASLYRGRERGGVVRGDRGEIRPPRGGRQPRDVAMRRGAKADRRVEELTAESEAES